jgi:hypothetical protein
MASGNLDLSDYRKFGPPYDEPPRQRGCFFYGCIIAGILSLLLVIAVGVMFFFIYRWFEGMLEEYTATAPRALPKVEMPAERRRTVAERFDDYCAAVESGRPTEPLVLDSQDLNALIEERSPLKDKVFVAIAGDRLKGQISFPLGEFIRIGLTRGRYLNGEAEFSVWLKDGLLFATISSLEVNGKRLPEEMLRQLRGQNLAQGINENPQWAEKISKLQSIDVKDGQLIIRARELGEKADGTRTGEPPRVETREAKVTEHSPKENTPSDRVPAPAGAPPAAPAGAGKQP